MNPTDPNAPATHLTWKDAATGLAASSIIASRGAHHLEPRDGRAGGHRDPHGMADHGRREGEPRGPRGRARETDPHDSSEGQRGRRQYDSESEDTLEDSASDSSRSDVYIDPEEARRRAAYVEHNRTHGFSCYEDLREGSRRRQYEAVRRALEEEMAMYDDDRFVPPRGRSLRHREEGPSRVW
ncbi:MAG: hypothetical protein Q9203_005940 [Teloschistes exilis]